MQILQAVNKTYYLLTLFPCIFSELVTSSTACGEVTQDAKGSSTAVVCTGRDRRSPEGSTGKTVPGVVGAGHPELHCPPCRANALAVELAGFRERSCLC